MGVRRVTSPDGREWEVRLIRVRLPGWRHSGYNPLNDASDLWSGVVAFLVLAPFLWVVLPLARVLLLLPFAAIRSLFSDVRWVEATCRSPAEISIRWKTSADRAAAVAAEVATGLGRGYEQLEIDGAVLESMTEPPGIADLER